MLCDDKGSNTYVMPQVFTALDMIMTLFCELTPYRLVSICENNAASHGTLPLIFTAVTHMRPLHALPS